MFYEVSHVPITKGRVQCPPILGFLSIYAYTHCHRTTKFDVVKHVEEGSVFRDQTRVPSQESGVSVLPNLWGSTVLCLHPLTQNYRIRHCNTWGEASLGQPRHGICTKASRGLSAIAELLVSTSGKHHTKVNILPIFQFYSIV